MGRLTRFSSQGVAPTTHGLCRQACAHNWEDASNLQLARQCEQATKQSGIGRHARHGRMLRTSMSHCSASKGCTQQKGQRGWVRCPSQEKGPWEDTSNLHGHGPGFQRGDASNLQGGNQARHGRVLQTFMSHAQWHWGDASNLQDRQVRHGRVLQTFMSQAKPALAVQAA